MNSNELEALRKQILKERRASGVDAVPKVKNVPDPRVRGVGERAQLPEHLRGKPIQPMSLQDMKGAGIREVWVHDEEAQEHMM